MENTKAATVHNIAWQRVWVIKCMIHSIYCTKHAILFFHILQTLFCLFSLDCEAFHFPVTILGIILGGLKVLE